MRKIVIAVAVFVATFQASAMQQCDSTSTSEVVFESSDVKVSMIGGDQAKKSWEMMTETALPDLQLVDAYDAEVKISDSLTCSKYEAAVIEKGEKVGRQGCLVYSCNVIESK